MAFKQADTYLDHPMFSLAMQNLQKGEWEAGLNKIENLINAYPLDAEMRALRHEMLLRARVDADEQEDKKLARRRRVLNFAIRLIVVFILTLLAFTMTRYYSSFIKEQFAITRSTLENQMREVELAVKLRDAQDFLNAGRTDMALTLINEIAAEDPNYSGLGEVKAQAEQLQTLETQYTEAIYLFDQGDLNQALALLKEVEKLEPYFRDVKLQIANLEQQTELGDLLAKAENAFVASDWEKAVELFEELYQFHPDFQTPLVEERLFTSYVKAAEVNLYGADSIEAIQAAEEFYRKAISLRPQDPNTKARQAQVRAMVEERLFRSYIQAAQDVLAVEPDSLSALKQADEYLTKALKLRPDAEEVALQRDLAHRFLEAQEFFIRGNWNTVIESLEYIYGQDKGYASGTTRQTLYEAYVARGDASMAIGDFYAALSDYQRAAVIAGEDPSSKLRMYEVQLKVAEAKGILGDYQDAVLLYALAIDLTNLKDRAQRYSSAMASALAKAEEYVRQGNYKSAYRSYRDAVTWATETFEIVEHVVDSDDYLSSLALEYHSTVSLIAEANNLANPNIIIPGQVLLIPILP